MAFCGRKVDDEKWAHYRAADIFCFPTHYSAESFGNVLLEAMMFELPVVSTAWRGVSGIVEEGVTGFLARSKTRRKLPHGLSDCWLIKSYKQAWAKRAGTIFSPISP